jgi:phenylpropionate dioxygenase-like ring-hydroxylating dioxygenase large terminal subunit
MIKLVYLLFLCNLIYSLKPNTRPSHKYYKNFLPLFWKVGKTKDFIVKKPQKIIFNDYPICLYRDHENNIKAISDICIHRSASLSTGKLLNNNCIQCPYHGWEYKDGMVESVPGSPEMNKKSFGVPRFEVNETNEDIYIRPSFDVNSEKGTIVNNSIYIPPEAKNNNYVRISGVIKIKRPHFLITENVLDMLHVSYVHSFGNNLSPVPFKIEYKDIDKFSGKTTFHYTAGPTSMSKILAGAKYVKVENEFYLPDTTVTRVYASDELTKTIVTHCYPIGKNESILHYDLYRNFLTFPLFDEFFRWQMRITLKEDVSILNNIYDAHIKGFISTKFDITQIKFREKTKLIKKEMDIDDDIHLN